MILNVSSESITKDGKWCSVITNTSDGENKPPKLSWTKIDGAECYAVYMMDTTAGNWLHWKAGNVTKTELALGEVLKDSQYVGPYPPSGTHTYVVTVYALAKKPDHYRGDFDCSNSSVDSILDALDTADVRNGNIIAKGSVSAVYTSGEIVKKE